jgi:hypothetical protein
LLNRVARRFAFKPKNPDLGTFWRALDRKIYIYFIASWNILWRFGAFYDHLVNFVFIWYNVSGFGIMYQENLATLLLNMSNKMLQVTLTGLKTDLLKQAALESRKNNKKYSENKLLPRRLNTYICN